MAAADWVSLVVLSPTRFLRPPTELRYCKQRSLLERTSERVEDEEAPGALDMSIKEECSSPSHND